jgi:mannose-6-phosphate isomerase-like protein (cupin superfamily)
VRFGIDQEGKCGVRRAAAAVLRNLELAMNVQSTKICFGVLCFLAGAGVSFVLISGSPAKATEMERPFIVVPGSVTLYSGQKGREADLTELLATSEQTGGKLGIFRQTIAPHGGPPTHLHQLEDEFFYVVSGRFNFKLGERVVSAPPGSLLFIPHNTPHTFKNVGTVPGVLLAGVAPGGFEMMFAERQGVDAETNKELMKKHHMVVVGPPLR